MHNTEVLRQLVKTIGLEPALRLVAGWGGSTLYVPDKYDPSHIIARVLGEEAAIKLELTYGGQTLSVPKVDLRAIETEVRVVRLLHSGLSQYATAWTLKLTKDRVKQIARKHRLPA